MFIFGIFIFFAIRRSDKIPLEKPFSQELEIHTDVESSSSSSSSYGSNNLSELLLARSNITGLNRNRSTNGIDIRPRKPELDSELPNIRKNLAKKQLLSFLEDPAISEMEKVERIRDPEMAELVSSSNRSEESAGIHGFRMGAGGFWRDWEDSIFLFL